MTPTHFRKLERMYRETPSNAYFDPALQVASGTSRITMQVKPSWFEAANAVHGSVFYKALDDAAFFAANSLDDRHLVLTSDQSFTILGTLNSNRMTASANVVKTDRNRISAEVSLVDEEGAVIARGTGTFTTTEVRLADVPGYQ